MIKYGIFIVFKESPLISL